MCRYSALAVANRMFRPALCRSVLKDLILSLNPCASSTGEPLLVQWEPLTEIEATWEDPSSFTKAYPNIDLEDKVILQE